MFTMRKTLWALTAFILLLLSSPVYAAGASNGEVGTEFIELNPLVLPIVDRDGVSQTVSVVVALEVHDSESAGKVKAYKPKITDAYIQDMYGVLNEHEALKGGVLQVPMIKKRLSRVTNHLLGEDVVHDVLLQVVQQRPI